MEVVSWIDSYKGTKRMFVEIMMWPIKNSRPNTELIEKLTLLSINLFRLFPLFHYSLNRVSWSSCKGHYTKISPNSCHTPQLFSESYPLGGLWRTVSNRRFGSSLYDLTWKGVPGDSGFHCTEGRLGEQYYSLPGTFIKPFVPRNLTV